MTYRAFIGGEWRAAARTFTVINPATLEPAAECADCEEDLCAAAVDAASDAFPDWAELGAADRAAPLETLAGLIVANRGELARLVTAESGKPLAEAEREVASCAAYLRYNAAEGRRVAGREVDPAPSGLRARTVIEPVGVALAITPWNYPLNTLCRKAGPALAAGCTVIAKPAPETPLSALELARLADEAGFPPGVFNVVATSRAREAAAVWMADPRVRKVAFTGSTAVGRELVRVSAGQFQRLSLELGGNAPALVFADADLHHAAAEIVSSRYRHAGQTCVCVQRVFADARIFEDLLEIIAGRVRALRTGNPEEDVDCGPLIREQALRRAEAHVEDAVAKGARVLAGGSRLMLADPCRGWFFSPTVLAGVSRDARIMREEVFAPVLAVSAFETEREAVEAANETEYGLVAYAFTADEARQGRLAARLCAGTIGLNTVSVVMPQLPFGGLKSSGAGKENGPEGFAEYLEIKAVVRKWNKPAGEHEV